MCSVSGIRNDVRNRPAAGTPLNTEVVLPQGVMTEQPVPTSVGLNDSSPSGKVSRQPLRRTGFFVRLDQVFRDGRCDNLGDSGTLMVRKVEPLPQRLIGHDVACDPTKHTVLVAGPNAITTIQFFEWTRSIQYDGGTLMAGAKLGGRQLQ